MRVRRTSSSVVAPVGWTATSNFSAVQYAAGRNNRPAPTDSSKLIGGGNNFFAGGPDNELATASQNISFADLASSVDAGMITFRVERLPWRLRCGARQPVGRRHVSERGECHLVDIEDRARQQRCSRRCQPVAICHDWRGTAVPVGARVRDDFDDVDALGQGHTTTDTRTICRCSCRKFQRLRRSPNPRVSPSWVLVWSGWRVGLRSGDTASRNQPSTAPAHVSAATPRFAPPKTRSATEMELGNAYTPLGLTALVGRRDCGVRAASWPGARAEDHRLSQRADQRQDIAARRRQPSGHVPAGLVTQTP